MGLLRPTYPALSNTAKLVAYMVGVPPAFHFYGFMAAIAVISTREVVKYATLWAVSHKEHLHLGRDDLVLTILFAITAIVMREGLSVGAVDLRAAQRSIRL